MPGQPTFVNPTRDPLLPAGIGIGLDRSQPLDVEFTFVTGGGGGVQDLAAPTLWRTDPRNQFSNLDDPAMSSFGSQVAVGAVYDTTIGGVSGETQIRVFNEDSSLVRTVRANRAIFVRSGLAFVDADTVYAGTLSGGVQGLAKITLSTGVVEVVGSTSFSIFGQVFRHLDGHGDDLYFQLGARQTIRIGGTSFRSTGAEVFRWNISSDTFSVLLTADSVITDMSVSSDRVAVRTSGTPNMLQFFDRDTGEERSENNVLYQQVSGTTFDDFAISNTSIYYRIANVRSRLDWWSQLRPTGEFTAWSIRRSVDDGSTWQYWSGTNWSGTATTELPLADLTMTGCVAARVGVTCWRTSVNPWTSGSGTHLFQVRTKDTRNSIWSDSITILPDSPLGIGITTPVSGGDISEAYIPRWSTTRNGAYYRVQSFLNGVLVQNSGVITSAAKTHAWSGSGRDQIVGLIGTPDVIDGASLVVVVEVWSTRFLRSEASVTGTVRYLPPNPPDSVQVLIASEDGYIRVEWIALAGSSGKPNPASIEVWRRDVRRPEKTEVLISRKDPILGSSDTHDDHWCPFNREIEYRVVTVGARDQHDPDIPWYR